MPKDYIFNHTIGVDVFDLHDVNGKVHLFLNILCLGTKNQIAVHVASGHGVPSAQACIDAFEKCWANWAGWRQLGWAGANWPGWRQWGWLAPMGLAGAN